MSEFTVVVDSAASPDDVVYDAGLTSVPTLFQCCKCGGSFPPDSVYEDSGRIICMSCVSRGVSPSQPQAPPRSPQHAVTAAAPTGKEPATASQAVASAPPRPRIKLLSRITCPHCWHHFPPEEILWVSQHAELQGDHILGTDAPSRFRPSRFNVEGLALDARGMECHAVACPKCHLTVPRDFLRTHSFFMSIIGVPASGKSYFLAAMTWELRRTMPVNFAMMFSDTDPAANILLNQSEETLFLQNDPDRWVKLDKTQTQGAGLYDTIQLGEQIISLPRPLLFTFRPTQGHPNASTLEDQGRIMCVYDNAGEHFQPGSDSVSSPVTQHMAKSKVLMFMYDPTQDPRFRAKCRGLSADPQLFESTLIRRQETVFMEAASRIRKYTGLAPATKFDRPLLVIVPKADVWAPLINLDLSTEPVIPHSASKGKLAGVDMERVESTSSRVREMLMEYAPEFVTAVEDFCQTIIYIPVSALGRGPEKVEGREGFFVPAGQIKPMWVTVPMIYAFAKWATGLIGAAKISGGQVSHPLPTDHKAH